MTSARRHILSVICLVCLTSAAQAEERASPIRDDAGLFQADTILRAEQQIEDIRRSYDRDLFVDTVKSASPRERKWFRFLWTRQVNRILKEHAQQRASESAVDGIYVVICNDPKDVHVVVRPADDEAFTHHDSEELRRTLARRLQDSGPDQALLAMIRQVRAALQAHAMRGQSTSVVNEFVLASILGGGVALWLVLCGVRFKIRARHAGRPLDDSGPEWARRTPALLGAMFGFPAAQWIYDKLYPCRPRVPEFLIEPEAPAALEEDAREKTQVENLPVEESPKDAPVSP